MRATLSALCITLCTSCSNAVPRPSDQRQLVVFSTGQSENVETLRQSIQPSQATSIDAAGTQMWSVDAADISALRTLEAEGRLAHLHVEQDDAWPVLREIAASASHAEAIRTMIGAAEPASYVIGRLAREAPLSAALAGGFTMSVPLPGGGEIDLERPRQLEPGNWQFEIEGGVAALSTSEAGLRGTIQTPRGVFLIRPLPNGDHVVYEPQRPSVPDEPPHQPLPAKPKPQAALDVPPLGVACADDTLRVLPLYTAQVETELAALGAGTVGSFATDAKRDTRMAIAANKLGVQIDVLIPAKIAFTHSNDLLAEVATLTSRGNRVNDEIRKLRAGASADLVMLFSTAKNACGAVLPEILTAKIARADQAYFVMTALIPACTFTFTHELGHVLGMRHHDDSTSAAEPLAYGFCEAGNTFSTITATYASCSGSRRLLWSDPNATIIDKQGKPWPAGDKVRHWEASVLPKQFKGAMGFHCATVQ